MIGTNKHREHFIVWRSARPFTTDIKEDWAIFFVKEVIVVPVPLLISSVVFVIEMIDLILKIVSIILIH